MFNSDEMKMHRNSKKYKLELNVKDAGFFGKYDILSIKRVEYVM